MNATILKKSIAEGVFTQFYYKMLLEIMFFRIIANQFYWWKICSIASKSALLIDSKFLGFTRKKRDQSAYVGALDYQWRSFVIDDRRSRGRALYAGLGSKSQQVAADL